MGKRIRYIDAMRGFTMILVVYSHICHFCLGDSLLGYNGTFFLFRLPCFFFISGWLFQGIVPCVEHVTEHTEAVPSMWPIVKKKFMVQIVPTVIFLLLLAPPPEFFHQLGTVKGGYWFTFVLFEFFLLYLLSVRCCRRWSWLLALMISIGSFCYGCYQSYLHTIAPHYDYLSPLLDMSGFLSIRLWQYYLFFYIGTLVRRHFNVFLTITNKRWVVMLLITVFSAIALTPHPNSAVLEYLRFNLGGIFGMLMVFVLFRHLYASQRLSPIASHLSPLEFVGTRTLDIYLLHYFFLPRFLMAYSTRLHAYNNSLLEFVVIMAIALIVLLISLLVSYIIRLSPFLGHYLFGAYK